MKNISNFRIFGKSFDELDDFIIFNLQKYSHILLRYSLGLVFIWFGILKPFGKSSANDLVEKTVFWVSPDIFIPILGIWEVLIGICLIVRKWNRIAIFLLIVQMFGTFLPLILLPGATFEQIPFVPTLEGQYIIKNLVLISAALVIGGNVKSNEEEKYL